MAQDLVLKKIYVSLNMKINLGLSIIMFYLCFKCFFEVINDPIIITMLDVKNERIGECEYTLNGSPRISGTKDAAIPRMILKDTINALIFDFINESTMAGKSAI
jgi:hypothetical protein